MPTNREKFVDLAEKRVNNAIRRLGLIGNLSNRASYEYTEQDIKRIFRALNSTLKESRNRFGNVRKDDEQFRLGRTAPKQRDYAAKSADQHSEVKLTTQRQEFAQVIATKEVYAKYYNSLSENSLDSRWKNRDKLNIGAKERSVIRQILRRKKGLTDDYDQML